MSVNGVCNPYITATLDTEVRETTTAGDTTLTPRWSTDCEIPVDIQQWSRSVLRVQVWNRDTFVTDDFLGEASMPLADLTPELWDEDATMTKEHMGWCSLQPRHEFEEICGEIEIGLRLIMSPKTTARAEAAGGASVLLNDVRDRVSSTSILGAAVEEKAKEVNARRSSGTAGSLGGLEKMNSFYLTKEAKEVSG